MNHKKKYSGHPFRKKWGQNFLTDKNLLEKIVRTIEPKADENFLEIGPGEGALTDRIFPKINSLVSVEIDPLLIKVLERRPGLKGVEIVHGDILNQTIDALPINNPVRIFGNIPYNITSPIIFWLIEQLDYWSDTFIMMQKEVADRLCAKVGTKAYGRLTVVVGAYLDIKYCFTIKPDVFIPKPKVESAIVKFSRKEEALIEDEKYTRFNKLVSTAFSQRRKMLRNTLKDWDISKEVQERINFTRRPETLTVKEFASMV
ncbi:MAG: 16S rRNA (adenine(1518)-N(6)/adenine(1519)-N(6))-dimethyltransferase RsmA [Candidatus Neomarinimicrobiota bacterium]